MEKKYFKKPLESLGYSFVDEKMVASDYFKVRNEAFSYPFELRNLSEEEIIILERNNNFCPQWSDFFVGPDFRCFPGQKLYFLWTNSDREPTKVFP